MRRVFSLLFVLTILCSSCVKESISQGKITQGEGASLRLCLGLEDFNMGVPSVTKSGELIASDEINSAAICLFKIDKDVPSNSRIVAYRIFINDHEDGEKYFFKNLNPEEFTGDIIDEDGERDALSDVPISSAGGAYSSGSDDTTLLDTHDGDVIGNEYGENGISPDKKTVYAEFEYSCPLHGDVERLRDGEYLLIALANFHEEPIIAIHRTLGYWIKEQIRYWQDHQGDEGFDGIVYDPIINGDEVIFGGSKQIIDARVRLYDAVIERLADGKEPPKTGMYVPDHGDVISSTSYVHNSATSLCASTSKNIKVKSGDNNFGLNLVRLSSRASFTINNYGTLPIVIEDFRLSPNFASAATYLFPVEGTYSEHNSTTWLGAPDPTSSHAIVPFVPGSSFEPNSSELFFDALLASGYDASGENPLSYSLRVSVADGKKTSVNYVGEVLTKSAFEDLLASEEWKVDSSKAFLLQTAKDYAGKKLIVRSNGEGKTPSGVNNGQSTTEQVLSYVTNLVENNKGEEYIWLIEKVSGGSFKIKSRSVGKYLKLSSTKESFSGYDLTYDSESANATIFQIGQYIGNHQYNNGDQQTWIKEGERSMFKDSYAFVYNKGTDETKEIYLNVLGNNLNLVSLNKWADAGSHFYLHSVIIVESNATFKQLNVPVKAFDKGSGVSSPLFELKRNTRLNVSINVSYNEKSQDFDFSVSGWDNEKEEGVIFN